MQLASPTATDNKPKHNALKHSVRRAGTLALRLASIAVLLALVRPVSVRAEAEGKPLIVGMEMAYPPFEMTDAAGKPQGVSVDLALALGEALERPVKFENIPFAGLIPALKTGKIDCIISSMTATPERARSVDFSEPYLKTGLCLLIAKDSSVQSIQDANQAGKTIVVKLGTTGNLFAAAELSNATVRVLDKETACVLEVTQGKADAFIYDQMSTFANWQRNKETTRPLLTPFKEEAWAVAVRKGNTALQAEINQFLTDYRAKGGFEQLGGKWLAEQKAEFKALGIPFFF